MTVRGNRIIKIPGAFRCYWQNAPGFSEYIIVGKMLHNILNAAVQNVAQPVQRVGFHILVVLQTVDQRTVDIMMGIQVVLCYASATVGEGH